MTRTSAPLLRGLAVAGLMVAWAVGAYIGSAGHGSPDVNTALGVAPLAIFAALLLWRSRRPGWMMVGGLAAAAVLAWLWPLLRQNAGLLFLAEHLAINLAFATLFGRTLAGPGEALITRFARAAHQGNLTERQRRYTRSATLAWTVFFLANATLSALLYALAPRAVWSAYANLLTAPLVGLMFAAEHVWRMRVLPPEERPSLAQVIRAWRQRAAAGNS